MGQTAVEWLVDESMKLVAQVMTGTLNEDTLEDDVYRIVTKAKEMEKEQIIEAFNQGNIYEGNFFDRVNINAEQYYNETFKSE
jgi:hypothetical protein